MTSPPPAAPGGLIVFLRARLDEDERVAREMEAADIVAIQWGAAADILGDAWVRFSDRYDPVRVLRDVESKRLLLDLHKQCNAGCYVVQVLALPYSDHPDLRKEWRP